MNVSICEGHLEVWDNGCSGLDALVWWPWKCGCPPAAPGQGEIVVSAHLEPFLGSEGVCVSLSVRVSVRVWGCSGVDHSACSSWPSSSVGSKAVPLNPASPVTPSFAFKKIYVFFNWRIIALQNFVVFCQTSA